jgi:hypothetical protein
MIRKSEYDALMARLNAPENSKLRSKLSLFPNGHDLSFHLKRIRDYVEYQGQSTNATKELLELDYTVSLRKANELMDKQGWK